jgi:hypothetical protein
MRRLLRACAGVGLVAALAVPANADAVSPDTGSDLHAVMLGSGEPARAGAAGTLDVTQEFGVYSFRPDGRWVTIGGYDVSAFTEEWVRVDLAARLMVDGVVSDDALGYEDAFTNWKLLYGPADDPYRYIFSLLHPSPWGTTISLPAENAERLTVLLGSDVDGHEDVAVVIGVSESDEGIFAIPFPEAFPAWMGQWTDGKQKVRLVEDHWGGGAQLAFWGFGPSFTTDVRRGVSVEDERLRVEDVAGPGALRVSAAMDAEGSTLSTTFLAYHATAAQHLAVEWRTPTETRAHSDLGGTLFTAIATDAGAGSYAFDLEVTTAAEASRLVTYVHDLWALDTAEVFPGLREWSDDDTPPAPPLLLTPGASVTGAAPSLVV